jgi:Zn-dependent protease
MSLDFIFSIIILIFSVVVHEVSHGFTAYKLGDNTAKYQGRLTLNPLKHLEWFGSFILPIITYVSGGFILGWAKPVPYNPYNLSNQKWGEALVALAGPLSNIFIAIIFGILVRFDGLGILSGLAFIKLAYFIVSINITLALFNLVPIPPLDGSKILFSIFPNSMYSYRNMLERSGPIILIIFVLFFSEILRPITIWLFSVITGVSI